MTVQKIELNKNQLENLLLHKFQNSSPPRRQQVLLTKAKFLSMLRRIDPYNTKQKPQGVFEFLSNPIIIFLISPAREKSS